MKGELKAIIEKAPEGGYWAICPEIFGDATRGLPEDTIQDVIAV